MMCDALCMLACLVCMMPDARWYACVCVKVINDFITPWYPNISDHNEFPNDIRDIFETLFTKVANRAIRVDWYCLTHLYHAFNEA